MKNALLPALLFCAALPCAGAGADALKSLQEDPSPAAAGRIHELYRAAQDKDQRLWLIQALGVRLKERADSAALEALLSVSGEGDPELRGSALRALAAFPALPGAQLEKRWLGRLESAARKGSGHRSSSVRRGAEDLRSAIVRWKDAGGRAPSPEPEGPAEPRRGSLAWLAALLLSFALLAKIAYRSLLGPTGAARTAVRTGAAPSAQGPYSQAIRSGEWLFASGQIALDPSSGTMVEGGVREQTRRALENLGAVLAAERLGYEDVVKTTVFLTDMEAFAEMNAVYSEFFKEPAPARSTVEVAALPKGALVEVEAVARG